jgi:hypothetical protein
MKIKVTKKQIFIAVGIIGLIVSIIIIIKLLQPTDTPPKTCDGGRTFYCGKNVCKNCGPNKEITQKTCDDGKDDCTCKDGYETCNNECCDKTKQTCAKDSGGNSVCCDNVKSLCGANKDICCGAFQSCIKDVCTDDCSVKGRKLDCGTKQCAQIGPLSSTKDAELIKSITDDKGVCSVNSLDDPDPGSTYCSLCFDKDDNFIKQSLQYPPTINNFRLGSTYIKQQDDLQDIGIIDTTGTKPFFRSFLPPIKKNSDDTDTYYSSLNTDYNKIESKNYDVNGRSISAGVWDAVKAGNSRNVIINTMTPTSTLNDCLGNAKAYNADFVYYVPKNEVNNTSYCITAFDYKNINNGKLGCETTTGYTCGDDGHTQKSTVCQSKVCGNIEDEIWYNQQKNGVNGCDGLNFKVEDLDFGDSFKSGKIWCDDKSCAPFDLINSEGKCTGFDKTGVENSLALSVLNTDKYNDFIVVGLNPNCRGAYNFDVYVRILNRTQKPMVVHSSISTLIDRYCGGTNIPSFLQPQNKCDFVLWGKSYGNGLSSPPGEVDITLDTNRTFSFQVNFNSGGSNNLTVDNMQCDCSFVTCQIYIENQALSGPFGSSYCTITVSIYSTNRNTFQPNKPPASILMKSDTPAAETHLYTIVNNKIDK